jgi:divalent metal cation (Fe/Co/Zn/Cd) transporter
VDGNHARTDGFVSLGVLASAGFAALGAQVADPIIGLVITLVILRITWQSWRTVSTTEPGEMIDSPMPGLRTVAGVDSRLGSEASKRR